MRFSTKVSETTTGEIKMRLYKGNIDPVSRKSPFSLYSLEIASFTMGASYDQKDALGFINLIGLPIKVRAALAEEGREEANEALGRAVRSWAVGSLRAISGSLDFDRRLLAADIQGSQAFARALEQVGILTAAEREQIVDGVRSHPGRCGRAGLLSKAPPMRTSTRW